MSNAKRLRVLCVDTEPETVRHLSDAGLEVEPAEVGYRTGRRRISNAPHEYDLIVCDLKQPACYDGSSWGPQGENDNYKCRIVPFETVTGEVLVHEDGLKRYETLRYQIIRDSQIAKSGHSFGPPDIFQAISVAGVPAVLFLNPEWAWRVIESPNFFGVTWHLGQTKASVITILPSLSHIVPEIGPVISLEKPLRTTIESGPSTLAGGEEYTFNPEPLVVNAIQQVFGQFIKCGAGSIWALPASANNPEIIHLFSERLQQLTKVPQRERRGDTVANQINVVPDAIRTDDYEYDVFVAHASEDKSFCSPLAEALALNDVRVWYDDFVLSVGDSLREKIDEGLSKSRYGIVVLSRAFFAKSWPKAELDGLMAKQTRSGLKVILPVWHEIGREEVESFSPILAGRVAARSIDGLDSVVCDLLEVLRPNAQQTKYRSPSKATPEVGRPGQRGRITASERSSQPRLNIKVVTVQPAFFGVGGGPTKKLGSYKLQFELDNAGKGVANKVRVAATGMENVQRLTALPVGARHAVKFLWDLEAQTAFRERPQFPAVVVEYEDDDGVKYEQRGSLNSNKSTYGYLYEGQGLGPPAQIDDHSITWD